MRDFVTKWTNIKIALNLHAWGNLQIIPFNYDSSHNTQLKNDFPLAQHFYSHLEKHGNFPKGAKMGNGEMTVGYSANGEASDWMLAERGIYALSPEIGTKSRDSQHFFLEDWKTIKDVAAKNHPWMLYATKQLQPWLHFNFTGIHENS